MSTNNTQGISILNLERSFRDQSIFKAQNLNFSSFGHVVLRGPNGSGKTTFLRILATLTAPTYGDALINGLSICKDALKVRKIISYVAATDGGFFRRLTGKENLFLFGKLRGIHHQQVQMAIQQYMEILSLDKVLDVPFSLASTGMKQSLALCCSLLHQPRVLLLDEPTRGLDQAVAAGVRQALDLLSKDRLIISASHSPQDWSNANSIWEFKEGRVQEVLL